MVTYFLFSVVFPALYDYNFSGGYYTSHIHFHGEFPAIINRLHLQKFPVKIPWLFTYD